MIPLFCRFFSEPVQKFLFPDHRFSGTAEALDGSNIETAYHSLYFFFCGDTVKNLSFADKSHDFWSYFCFHHGQFGAPQQFRSLCQYRGGKTGIFHLHPLLINDQHGYGLCCRSNLSILLFFFLL